MNKKTLLLIIVIFAVMNVTFVAGQALDDAFDALRDSGFIGSFSKFPRVWDAIALFLMFIILGREILSKYMNDSKPAGGTLGAVLAILAFGGLQVMDFSLIEDFGPWVLILALVALLLFFFRLYRSGEGAGNLGAATTFAVLTLVLHHDKIAVYIKNIGSCIVFVLYALWFISGIWTVVWVISLLGGGGGADGNSPGGLNRAANAINRARDGGRNLRDAVRGRPSQRSITQLEDRIATLVGQVHTFQLKVDELNGECSPNYSTKDASPMTGPQRTAFHNNVARITGEMTPLVTNISSEIAGILGNTALPNISAAATTQFTNLQADFTADQGRTTMLLS